MDALSRFVAHTWTSLVALIAARTALTVAHLYGWYPEKILAARLVAINKRRRIVVRRLTARFESPPIVPDAPGLVWKRRKDGWLAIWKARPEIVKDGFAIKQRRLLVVEKKCTAAEMKFIADMCTNSQFEMLNFERSARYKPKEPMKQKKDQEPTIEDILASIRRIIASEPNSPSTEALKITS
jgi:hypothetical protein